MIHMTRKARVTAAIVLAVGAGAVAVPLAFAPGATAAPGTSPGTPTPVPGGVSVASLPGVTVFGDTPSDTSETVSFVLKEQNIGELEEQVDEGIPNSDFLSVSQFASKFGQSTSNISALTSYLAGFGIKSTVYPDDVDVVTTGTAGDYDSALSITEETVSVPAQHGVGGWGGLPAQGANHNIYTNKQAPLLPYHLANFVSAILGLSNYGAYVNNIVKPSTHDAPQQGNSNSCVEEFGLTNGCHLPSFFTQTYNLNPLYERANGAGQTVGIVTLAAVDSGTGSFTYAPQQFWSEYGIKRTGSLTVDNVDGGPGAPSGASGSGETDLDIEQSGSIAPGANVIDYQAPNTDYGFADAFFTAASQNLASGVSASWGESETNLVASVLAGQESAGYVQAFDEAFLEMAAQGQSAFTSSADEGAYTASRDIGTTNLNADDPADSPYITAAGGTSLPGTTYLSGPDGDATATTTTNRIWGWDYLWAPIAQVTGLSLAEAAEDDVVGSGGGFSQLEPEPVYQKWVSGTSDFHAVQYLTPTDYTEVAPGLSEPTEWNFNATPSVSSGSGHGRAVPDLATDADPQTGYLVEQGADGGLTEAGGTSFVAPQLNGSTAVIDSYLGHRVGFWNPSMYDAVGHGNDPFSQLNSAGTGNDNIYYTGNPGQDYNEGIGLGVPNLASLANILNEGTGGTPPWLP
jgi:kumamolisin